MTIDDLRLMPGRILLDMDACQEKTLIQLKMVDSLKHRGLVVKVGGPGIDKKGRSVPIPVSVGHKVTFTARSGTDIQLELNGEPKLYRMIKTEDLIAILEDDEPVPEAG